MPGDLMGKKTRVDKGRKKKKSTLTPSTSQSTIGGALPKREQIKKTRQLTCPKKVVFS